jgi:hypothetical protein
LSAAVYLAGHDQVCSQKVTGTDASTALIRFGCVFKSKSATNGVRTQPGKLLAQSGRAWWIVNICNCWAIGSSTKGEPVKPWHPTPNIHPRAQTFCPHTIGFSDQNLALRRDGALIHPHSESTGQNTSCKVVCAVHR